MTDSYNAEWENWLQRWFIRLLIPAILVNAGSLFIDILEPDGALYATVAKTIARSGDFINLYRDGRDWLDKPHFPFWIAAFSFRIFGINAFAYKFPALLFWGAGAWYTWRLALALYGKSVGQLSCLIYVSAAHLVISNNDVRAEPYLTGLIIGSVYHFYKASRIPARKSGYPGVARGWTGLRAIPQPGRLGLHLVAGALLAAAALMTKGPFVLITIAGGFVLDWIIGKEWTQFRHIRWWVAAFLIACFTLPELYCLYVQFDLHPEKQVFGHTGVSGIRFFFWDSQFGRFFNTGPIKGSGDPLFYFHTLLWAFLPWSILLYAAVIRKCRSFRRNMPGDWICLGTALGSFILFSLSRFQLPHYLNILFPFFSILTASWLFGIRRSRTLQFVRIVQGIINAILPVLLLLLCWLFHFRHWPLLLVLLAALASLPYFFLRGAALPVSVTRSFWLALLVYAFVNFLLYPAILQYQAGTQAGRYVNRMRSPPPIYIPWEAPDNFSFEFYCDSPVARIRMDELQLRPGPGAGTAGVPGAGSVGGSALLFAPSAFRDSLQQRGYTVTTIHEFPNFHISQLTGKFLNWQTRDSVLEKYALLQITR